MQYSPHIKKIDFNTPFPISPNLPDMTQADFLKSLMQMAGIFAYVRDEHKIGFISVDDIMAKKNKYAAKDWTSKLLNTPSTFNTPEGIEFKLDAFAQRNLCKWDDGDDDTLKGKYDGVLVVDNETIENERECFTLPFAPSANADYTSSAFSGKIAKIPIYNDNNGTVDYDGDITPRILNPTYAVGYSGASFENMDLQMIVNTKYKSFQEIIRTPRVIKLRCLLSDYDLSTLDLTAPVYFEQFGNYYAILKVQAAADGVSKCEFLEI